MSFLKRVAASRLLSAVLLLVSCGGSGGQGTAPAAQTIKWQPDGSGFIQFSTNDPKYYQYSFWTTHSLEAQAAMTTVTATVKKKSGSGHSGYGILFCYQDQANFYRLTITMSGYYQVSRKVAGSFSDIVAWTTSARLNKGFDIPNQISVTQTSTDHFSVQFNGSEETTFTDYSFTGGSAGFVASVSSEANENFPAVPEDVRYNLSSPIPYP